MIERFLDFLIRSKNDLKNQAAIAAYCDEPDAPVSRVIDDIDDSVDDSVDDADDVDDDPLTWAEQKNIRKELRRFQLWHALRVRVPKGLEESV